MAPLDTVHRAVSRTAAAGTARLRIAHLLTSPAPACSLPKHAQLDFHRRVALVTEPVVTPFGLLGDKLLERWPWLGDEVDLASREEPAQSLFVGSVRLMRESPAEPWENLGSGISTSPFGIFDRLATADAAVARRGLIRFRLPPPSAGHPPELGDLALDDDGCIRQIVFTPHPPARRRAPERLRVVGHHWIQVDVLELGSPVTIEVPDPAPEPPSPPEPASLRDTIGLARRLLARRRTG